jgi:hypothetical protein
LAKLFASEAEAIAHDNRLLTDKMRQERVAEQRRLEAKAQALEDGAKPEDVQNFSGILNKKQRDQLRAIVRREHFAQFGELMPLVEVDKFIDGWAESYVEKQLRRGNVYGA